MGQLTKPSLARADHHQARLGGTRGEVNQNETKKAVHLRAMKATLDVP